MNDLFLRTAVAIILAVSTIHCDDPGPSTGQLPDTAAGGDAVADSNATDTGSAIDTTDGDDTSQSEDADTEIVIRVDVNSLTASTADFMQAPENGIVLIEVENYTAMIPAEDGSTWMEADGPDGVSGKAMQSAPSDFVDHKEQIHAQNHAPILVYTVHFAAAGQYYVWARAAHIDGYTDSVWFGKNGVIEGSSPLSFWDDEHIYLDMWYWIGLLMEGAYAVLDIPEPGNYTFELYMREPDFFLDQIALTTDPVYNPNLL